MNAARNQLGRTAARSLPGRRRRLARRQIAAKQEISVVCNIEILRNQSFGELGFAASFLNTPHRGANRRAMPGAISSTEIIGASPRRDSAQRSQRCSEQRRFCLISFLRIEQASTAADRSDGHRDCSSAKTETRCELSTVTSFITAQPPGHADPRCARLAAMASPHQSWAVAMSARGLARTAISRRPHGARVWAIERAGWRRLGELGAQVKYLDAAVPKQLGPACSGLAGAHGGLLGAAR